ncbi:S8 family serine peptidase [Phosphitispora fastidiosa]|uniref:S8 family serine peptidase n=1 Tax=Phosphitispora fastidiosa TaxID=2837202 RepID=UPI001E550743|nr:S8 family serine peptidase [Phosphitispora fastidiosa]MBU7008343.1 subtilisin family serine protease [Phosphitispora fastidiosa]
MIKHKKIRFLAVLTLIFAMMLPQTAGASEYTAGESQHTAGAPQQMTAASSGTPQRMTAVSPGVGQYGPEPVYRQGEVIFKTGRLDDAFTLIKKYGLKMVRRDTRLGYVVAETPADTNVAALSRQLSRENTVQYAQPNYTYRLFGTPNDSQYGRQWAMKQINAENGWGVRGTGAPVIIAVLDSGVDVNHPDLKGRLVRGVNTVNPLKSARDSEGHGTHVAGIAGAAVNNGVGVAGVAGVPGVKIMPVKVFDGWDGTDTSISDGIIWAADHGARVINMSFGSWFHSEVLNEAIEYAYGKGVVMVAAAGNWASEDISYPAAISKVISVSATDREGSLAEFSSYGPLIDVCAPGEDIYSSVWDPYKGSTYTEMSGTSMASPMVAGLAALLLAKDPGLTAEDVRQIIEVTAADLGEPGWDPEFGHGRIDIGRALAATFKTGGDSNNSMENAVILENDRPVLEKIGTGGDVDWFKITIPAGNHLQVEVLPAGKVSPGVEVCDSSGEAISAFNTIAEGASAEWETDIFAVYGTSLKVAETVYGLVTDLEEGDYYIKVFGNHFRWSEENYTVTARILADAGLIRDANEPNNTYEEAKKLELGKTVNGVIGGQADEDWFQVRLTGKAYKISVDVPDGLDLAVAVENSNNFSEYDEDDYMNYYSSWYYELINNAGQGEGEEGVIILPESGSGTYYLRVYDTGGASLNANYSLTVSGFSFARDRYERNDTWKQAAQVALGEEITGNFHSEQDEDWYEFDVPETGLLSVDFQEPKGGWCSLYVFSDPEEEALGYSNGSADYGYLGDSEAGGSLAIKVKPGKYYISVSNWGYQTADNYQFKVESSRYNFVDQEMNDEPLMAVPVVQGVVREGTIFPDDDLDFYVFDVVKPQPFLVYVTPPDELDTAVVVMKEIEPGDSAAAEEDEADTGEMPEPELMPVTEIDSGTAGQPDSGVFTPAKPGRYYIAILSVEGRSEERYSFVIKPFTASPDAWENNDTRDKAAALTGGVAVKPTFMGTEDIDWYKVYIPDAGVLGVTLDVPGDIDGVFEAYGPDGRLLGRVDQSMTGIEEVATFNIFQKGYYFIKAYDYLGNSSVQPYALTARYLERVAPVVSEVKTGGREISFRVSEDVRVFIKVIDSSDRFIAMVKDDVKVQKGKVSAIWNGKDAQGGDAPAGSYKVKIVVIDNSGNASKPVFVAIKI